MIVSIIPKPFNNAFSTPKINFIEERERIEKMKENYILSVESDRLAQLYFWFQPFPDVWCFQFIRVTLLLHSFQHMWKLASAPNIDNSWESFIFYFNIEEKKYQKKLDHLLFTYIAPTYFYIFNQKFRQFVLFLRDFVNLKSSKIQLYFNKWLSTK